MKNFRKVSIGIFINENKEILLQKRGKYSKNGEDYAFFGGGAEKNETPEKTFIREMREELGLLMKDFDYEFLGTYETFYEKNDFLAIRSIFVIKTDKKLEEFKVFEGEKAEYFSIFEARKLKFPNPVLEIFDLVEKYIQENF
ncbi:hypothetical protein DLH72_00340 [Candidatus Gracilibacteria bacterium]|nr:MAG: hypothetical protein DLH72_00340 [Candidatus Gracilibacteria bacterium]